MLNGYSKIKISANLGLRLATLVWTVVGVALIVKGALLFGFNYYGFYLLALVVGLIKAKLIIDRVARANCQRLQQTDKQICFLAFFPIRTWLIIVVMIIVGRLIGHSDLVVAIRGTVPIAVGVALLFSSRILWQGSLSLK